MEFYIADTFTDSVKRLNNAEQKLVKTTAFDLQMDQSLPSLQFHRIDKAKDPNFWSIRVTSDIRIILHKKENRILLCYVDHHDKAYQWAEKRRIEVHPKTGAVQIVVLPETVLVEQSALAAIDSKPKHKKLFAKIKEADILACGVPADWISRILDADEDSIFDILQYLPAEAGEALLDLAAGKKPELTMVMEKSLNPFTHPDSQRRFRLVTGQAEMEEALLASWSKWAVFLHPHQKSIVEKEYKGPVRISGSAGTGKTIVALHRATFLAKKDPEARILLATFSDILSNSLHQNFVRLIANTPKLAEQVEVVTLEKLALRHYKRLIQEPKIISLSEIKTILQEEMAKEEKLTLSKNLISVEFLQVIDAWNLTKWEDYKDFSRLGRRTKLNENQRKEIWNVCERVNASILKQKAITASQMYSQVAKKMQQESHSVFDAVIIDEAQDLTPSQMEFVSSLSKEKKNFFFTGDLGQRIFQIPFSWNSFGMDIRGRSVTLKVNYRTSQQIRLQADRLLADELSDFDGNVDRRAQTISLFQGPKPEMSLFASQQEEIDSNQKWIKDLLTQGFGVNEILLIVRSEEEYSRVIELGKALELDFVFLDKEKPLSNKITVSTMHNAKGLEYRAVLILACDSAVLPKSSRIAGASDEAELGEVYATERHLLYVACTRARDVLRITGIKPGSEFLVDMKG